MPFDEDQGSGVPGLVGEQAFKFSGPYNPVKSLSNPLHPYMTHRNLICMGPPHLHRRFKETMVLVKGIAQHFRCFCRQQKLDCVELYVVQETLGVHLATCF